MNFLLQIKKDTNGEYTKGTSQYESDKEALTALYVAMSSAMSKEDTQSIMCLITDEYGSQKKREYWSAPSENVSDDSADEQ